MPDVLTPANRGRTRKTDTEIAGLRRAQRACEAALDVVRELLRATTVGETLSLDGAPLTSERLRAAVRRVFDAHDVVADEVTVSHGPQTAVGHEPGFGAILPDEPIVLDLFPRDRVTGMHSDMTRTYVVGTPSAEIVEYHRFCREALRLATPAVKPGVNGRELMHLVCDLFSVRGLASGFLHDLGHGVGLELHEPPWISRAGDDLIAGDVIALEPGLYRSGYGGVRLEDILIVTDDGAEVVTSYPYDLVP